MSIALAVSEMSALCLLDQLIDSNIPNLLMNALS